MDNTCIIAVLIAEIRGGYNDTIDCSEFPGGIGNITAAELEQETLG